LWVPNIPPESKANNANANKYLKDHLFELRKKIWIYNWSSQLYTQLNQLRLE